MKRKPATRRPTATKKPHVVGIKVSAKPTPKQLAALKKLFRPKAIATAGIAAGASILQQRLAAKRKPRT
jgi:hypothetical protein